MPKAKQKAKYKQSEILSPQFDLPDNYEDLVKVYKTLAKSADTRMRRLEKLTEQEYFKGAELFAYRRALHDINRWNQAANKTGATWDIAPPKSKAGITAKIEDIKRFLKSETSTKTGLTNIQKKRAATINKNYDTNFSWKEWAKFANSSLNKNLDKNMGSAEKIRVIARIRRKKKEVVQAVQEANTKDIDVGDDMVGQLVKDTLKEYGEDVVKELLGK